MGKDSVDLSKAASMANALAAKYGIVIEETAEPDEEYSTISASEVRRANRRSALDYTNSLEVVINSLHHEHASTMKVCKFCGEQYITTYCYHQYCSDRCRDLEFRQHFGIDPHTLQLPPSEWTYEDVGVVPPYFTKRLYEWAKSLTTRFESLTDRDIEELPSGEEEPAQGSPGLTEFLEPPQAIYEELHLSPQANPPGEPYTLDFPDFDFGDL